MLAVSFYDMVRYLVFTAFLHMFLQSGADLTGVIKRSGIGEPTGEQKVRSAAALRDGCLESNRSLGKSLKSGEHDAWLLETARAEALLGRMSKPKVFDLNTCDSLLLQPRFAVEQSKPDGSVKLRSIHHFSWAPGSQGRDGSVNGHTAMEEKLRHNTLDNLSDGMIAHKRCIGKPPGLFKADIDSALRHVPIKPEHRWACGIAFRVVTEGRPVTYLSCCESRIVCLFPGIWCRALGMSFGSSRMSRSMGARWRSHHAYCM